MSDRPADLSITVRVIGIGPGGPGQLTLDAVDAIGATDVFLLLDKGSRVAELNTLREELVARYGRDGHRVVRVPDPPRDRDPADYDAEVRRWHRARGDALEALLRTELSDGQSAAFLVWGDPSLYDSTLRIVDELRDRDGLSLDVSVIPGVTSAAALTAAFGITAQGIGQAVHITTGRRLAQTPAGADANQIVMLDSHLAFTETAADDDHVYWGAFLGTEHQLLISGRVGEVAESIAQARRRGREEHGWIMDIYLLRRASGRQPGGDGA